MANDWSSTFPVLLTQGLQVLRNSSVMPMLINQNYSAEAVRQGDTIQIPLPSALSATPVNPGHLPTAAQESSPTHALIVQDKWIKSDFYLTDKELGEVQRGTIPMQVGSAIEALVSEINSSILATYTPTKPVSYTHLTLPTNREV